MNEDSKRDPVGEAHGWWAKTIRASERQTGADRASRARLRRAGPAEAMCEEATHDLFHAMYGAGRESVSRLPRVATLACVLAHIREDDNRALGRAAGKQGKDERGVVALSRIKRLLDAREEEEIVTRVRRLIDILGGKARVGHVAQLVLFIEDDRTRRDFLFRYFDVPTGTEKEEEPAASAPA